MAKSCYVLRKQLHTITYHDHGKKVCTTILATPDERMPQFWNYQIVKCVNPKTNVAQCDGSIVSCRMQN